MVPAAVQFPLLVEVDEVNEELPADRADEAIGMPTFVRPSPGGHHTYVSRVYT